MQSFYKTQVGRLAQEVYDLIREEYVYPSGTDLSRSNRCDLLSQAMQSSLRREGIASRRELHLKNGLWHYVVAVTENSEATINDPIVDLNPWQYNGEKGTGHLFLAREELQETLRNLDAPEWFVALRGAETIYATHTLMREPTPAMLAAS